MKIYTRRGDGGETALVDGRRVSKADLRIDACGAVDELNAVVGLVRTAGVDEEIAGMLASIQRDLFALGGRLADPDHRIAARVGKTTLGGDGVARLEGWIDHLDEELPPLSRFILPGGSQAGAALHLARTVCRRAERRMVALGPGQVEPVLLAYVNRLSDLLFVMARAVNQRAGESEIEW